jgi:hypothetical protein
MRAMNKLISLENTTTKPAHVIPRRILMAVFLFVFSVLIAGNPVTVVGQDSKQIEVPVAKVIDTPMASFAKMLPGEWKVTAASGTSMYHTWHWGPGNHSIRRFTDGKGADGKNWREVNVYYWHPDRKQICLLGFSPFANGLSEGTITFDGESAEAVVDLHQIGSRRKMGLHWKFEGPDKYREKLLEKVGDKGFQTLVEFDHLRSRTAFEKEPIIPDGTELDSRFPEHLKPLEPLLGKAWQSTGKWLGKTVDIQTTIEWIPLADMMYLSVKKTGVNGESTHLLDGYLYRHTGTKALRCLALANDGRVCEGEITVAVDGGVQIDLKCYDKKSIQRQITRIDFQNDGTMQQRLWNQNEVGKELILELTHER